MTKRSDRNGGLLVLATMILLLVLAFDPFGETRPHTPQAGGEGGASEGSAEKTVFSLATSGDWSSSPRGAVMEEALKKLENTSGGGIRIKVYDRNQMGDDLRAVAAIQLGTIDMITSSPSTQVLAVPEAALMDIPGLFTSLEQFNTFAAGEYLDVMRGYYGDAGLQLLTVYAYSFRQMTCNRPVEGSSDLDGLRIRTVENKYQEALWQALGATPVPYSFERLYFMLHQGIVDAQENPVDILLSEKLMEVQSHLILSRHMPMIQVVVMNKARYESLSEQEREQVNLFAKSLRQMMILRMPENEENIIETLDNDYGMVLSEVDGSFRRELMRASQTVIAMLREDLGDEKVDVFLAAVSAAAEGW